MRLDLALLHHLKDHGNIKYLLMDATTLDPKIDVATIWA